MSKKSVIQPQDKYVVRLPDGLRDRIKAASERNGRSMNAEIVATLESKYPDPGGVLAELGFLDEIEQIKQKLERLRLTRLAEISSSSVSSDILQENADKFERDLRKSNSEED
jgi:hypothetical protein